MNSKKISNKNKIKDKLDRVNKLDLTMNYSSSGLPIFYEYTTHCDNNDIVIGGTKPSKPCILCNSFCSSSISVKDITKPKLTRQTNEITVDYKTETGTETDDKIH